MSPRSHYLKLAEKKGALERFCEAAGTSVENYKQLAIYGGCVGGSLAVSLAEASKGKMTVTEIIKPKDPLMIEAREKRRRQKESRALSKGAA